jgi:hypothetical protein
MYKPNTIWVYVTQIAEGRHETMPKLFITSSWLQIRGLHKPNLIWACVTKLAEGWSRMHTWPFIGIANAIIYLRTSCGFSI